MLPGLFLCPQQLFVNTSLVNTSLVYTSLVYTSL